jgi:hypothetical protein
MKRLMSVGFLLFVWGVAAAQQETKTHAAKEAKAPLTVKEPKLREDLLARVKTDQAARMAMIEFMKKQDSGGHVVLDKLTPEQKVENERLSAAVDKADKENTKWLGEIVEKHGWPTISLVGKDGSNDAWLLAQHADRDPKFQRKCLDLMTKAPKEEVSQKNLAYLTDRVLLAEGKKQIYGTQFTSTNGKWEPRALEDPENVDKRRKEVGLPPLSEYVKMMEQMYGKPGKK